MRLAATLLSILLPGFAAAAGPEAVNYEGVLTDSSGMPLDGAYDVRLGLYPLDPTAPGPTAAPIVEQTFTDAPVSQGRLQLLFGGSPGFADHFRDFDDLYIVLDVDLDDSGTFEEAERYAPATRLANAPFALSSSHADTAETAQEAAIARAIEWRDIENVPGGLDDGDDDLLAMLEGESSQAGDVLVYSGGRFQRQLLYSAGRLVFPDGSEQARAALDPGEVGREAGVNSCSLSVTLDGATYNDVEIVGDFVVEIDAFTPADPEFGKLVVRRALTGDASWRFLWRDVGQGSVALHETALNWDCTGPFDSFGLSFLETLVEDYEIKPSDSGLYYEYLHIFLPAEPQFDFLGNLDEPFSTKPPTLGLRNGNSMLPAPGNQADEAVIALVGSGPVNGTLLSGISFDGNTTEVPMDSPPFLHSPAVYSAFEFAIRPTALPNGLQDSIFEMFNAAVFGSPPPVDFRITLESRGDLRADIDFLSAQLTRLRLYQADDGMPLMDLQYTAEATDVDVAIFE